MKQIVCIVIVFKLMCAPFEGDQLFETRPVDIAVELAGALQSGTGLSRHPATDVRLQFRLCRRQPASGRRGLFRRFGL